MYLGEVFIVHAGVNKFLRTAKVLGCQRPVQSGFIQIQLKLNNPTGNCCHSGGVNHDSVWL